MIRCLRGFIILCLLFAASPAATAAAAENEKSPKPEPSDYELYKLLIDGLDQIGRNYVAEVDRRKLVESALRGALAELDPYSSFITAEELRQFRDGVESEFCGIGVQIDAEAGRLKVLSPIHGTPAYRAGLAAGDSILEIDGRPTKGLSIDEAVNLLKGEAGSGVTLVVAREGEDAPWKISLVREKIHLDTVLGDARNPDGSWNFMLDPAQRIGYVRVVAFGRDTAAELRRTLAQLTNDKLRGLVLDLRFNPGGLLAAAVETGDLFVAKGLIVAAEGRNNPRRTWEARPEGTFEGFPMAVLVNRYSASSSEIVAACLQDHRRAIVVGERTWGKGSVQNLIELADGRGALKLTTAGYQRPNGKNIHRFPNAREGDEWGVTPDEGYRIALDGRETLDLIQDRRERDILRPAAAEQKQPAAADRQLQAALKYLAEKLGEDHQEKAAAAGSGG